MVDTKIRTILSDKRQPRKLVVSQSIINRKTCKYCKSEFYSFPSHHRRYCSKKCSAGDLKNIQYAKKPKTGIWKKCLTCRKEIYCQKWQSRHRKYCSSKCRANNPESIKRSIDNIKNVKNIGKDNPRYIDGRWIYRKAVFNMRENKCEICGEKDMSRLIAHHLDGDRSHNTENNFIISCYSCHSLIHKLSSKTEEQRNKINSLLIGKRK